MLYVVDASVAAKWIIEEPDSGLARKLLEDPANQFIAPELIHAEVLNVLWRKTLKGDLSEAAAHQDAAALDDFIVELVPIARLAARSLVLALELRHPVYDCLYLALSEQRAVPLVTADRRFHGVVHGTPWAARTKLLA
jgi:predicted nucleic acid-binding protein